jgi:APA family basic amino acid/polyamine antiporter
MVPYQQISVDAPVANAFQHVGLVWAQLVISIGAVIGITSVLLVLMLSQPRVWLAMARDGLVPRSFFGAVHPRFRTPWKATILTGVAVGLLSGLVPLRILAELVSIGTLLAFVIVCVGVLVMRSIDPGAHRPFRAPLVPFVPAVGALLCLLLMLSLPPHNWLRLLIWLLIGFVVYFGYGRKHSVMARMRAGETVAPIAGTDESCPMEPEA